MSSILRSKRAGFSLLELLVVLAIIGVAIGLVVPAVQKAREASNKTICQNNLHQLGLAMQMYQDREGSFPAGFLYTPPPPPPPPPQGPSPQFHDRPPRPPFAPIEDPGWGWGSLLLPYLEQTALAGSINYSIPVESPSTYASRRTILSVFVCPSDYDTGTFTVLTDQGFNVATAATNSYAACFGAGGLIGTLPDAGNGVFFRNSAVRSTDIKDGTSYTFALGERGAFFTQTPWAGVMTGGTARTTPGAPVFRSVVEPSPTMVLARIGNKALNDPYAEPYDFFSPHAQVTHFAFADGAVHAVRWSTDQSILQALATAAGQEPLPSDEF
jgi:prepilin-type N-terminal cleavage/methylation domain-containing protein